MAKTIVAGSDLIGQFNPVCPIRFHDPVTGDIHAPVDVTVTDSDPSVARGAVYNMMLMIRLEGIGECDISLEATVAASGRKLRDSVHVKITQDPQPDQMDIDVDGVTWEPADAPHC